MASFHRCQNCGCETDISSALTAFEENPHCRQCGLSVAESDSKMQDDLVNMMTQHLQLNTIQHQPDASMPATPQVVPQVAPITYITQHYHHSAHQATAPTEYSASAALEAAGVNASALLPSQLSLFRNAEHEQQQRLIELWRIAPPTPGNQMLAKDLGNWPQTNMQLEEEAARYRWELLEQERLKNLCALPSQDARLNAEPYIISGYGNLSNTNGLPAHSDYGTAKQGEQIHKPSTEPVYNSREWWKMADQEPMEHQYGMHQQMMQGSPVDSSHTRQKEDEDMW